MGIKKLIANIGNSINDKVGNATNKVAALSSTQLKEVQDRKDEYLTELFNRDPSSEIATEITARLLATVSTEIYNAYLPQIKELYKPVDATVEYCKEFDSNHNIRYVNITKWVTDKKENSLEKLVNVYETLSKEKCNISLIFNRKKNETQVYLAVVDLDNGDDNEDVNRYKKRIIDSIKGNFPGSEVSEGKIGTPNFLDLNKDYSVATVSNIPAEKSEKFNTQTIEKLIDGIVPENEDEEWTLILVATPADDINERKLRLGELYSALAPYKSWQTNYTMTENLSKGGSATAGVNLGTSVGSQVGQFQSKSVTQGTSQMTIGAAVSSGVAVAGGALATKLALAGATTSATGAGATVGIPLLIAAGVVGVATVASSLFGSKSDSVSETLGTSQGVSRGFNFGANFARTSSTTAMIGKNEGITQNFVNYNIQHSLEVLKEQMKRLEQSAALGLWDFAAYVLSENDSIANNVAHSYIALTQGEKSFMSESAVNIWRGDSSNEIESESAKEIVKYIKDLRHPIFGLNLDITKDEPQFNVYPTTITPTTSLSGKELAYSLNFPKKSISGMPVIECAEFGRNISTFDEISSSKETFDIGNIFHMHHIENVPVKISKKSLASHVFITGSTGSGKSNTVYEILNEAIKNNVKFMVVEPTKGEYKDVFCVGDNKIAKVYGTNKDLTPLLRINPFSFEKDIHVFEHMDRLVEIFNVCWPMYAAMPAVLKSAIEKSYEDCGWNLVESTNQFGDNLYPNFSDVARNVKQIIESSEYDTENKGAYKGSLLTRLESLTNGINGLIFTNDEIAPTELFDENVIIDISRVGSNETKSLIMGMMVLKLQEHRMANKNEMNVDLKHLTVLEEAHNLLKRTSTEVSQDSGNLLGKSVEMISNAIAEMRTYGEGFIIVDQAPGLLDMAAIRNTNTKIIMRLPDEMDRRLVGKAANLNDDQIIELAKLPMGVGAVYQNEWIEPVLCKINYYEIPKEKYTLHIDTKKTSRNVDELLSIFELLSRGEKITDKNRLKDVVEKLRQNNINSSAIVSTIKLLQNPPKELRMSKLAPITASMFPELIETIKNSYKESSEKIEWTISVRECLQSIINKNIDSQIMNDIVVSAINQYLYITLNNKNNIYQEWKNAVVGG